MEINQSNINTNISLRQEGEIIPQGFSIDKQEPGRLWIRYRLTIGNEELRLTLAIPYDWDGDPDKVYGGKLPITDDDRVKNGQYIVEYFDDVEGERNKGLFISEIFPVSD